MHLRLCELNLNLALILEILDYLSIIVGSARHGTSVRFLARVLHVSGISDSHFNVFY